MRSLTLLSLMLLYPIVTLTLVEARDVSWEEQMLIRVPGDFEIETRGLDDATRYDVGRNGFPFTSVDGKSYAFIATGDDGAAVQQGGDLDRRFKDVPGLYVSASGAVAYAGLGADGWQVVVGKSTSKAYEEVGEIVFSADGLHHAYAARAKKEWRLIVDGQESAKHAEIRHVTMSADGKTVAYVAVGADGTEAVVLGGSTGKSYKSVGKPTLNARGTQATYCAATDNGTIVVTGTSESRKSYTGVTHAVFAGKNAVFRAGNHVVKGKKETPELDWLSDLFVVKKNVYFVGLKGSDLQLFKDTKSIGSFSLIGKNPRYAAVAPDGKTCVYISESPFSKDTTKYSVVGFEEPGRPWVAVHPKIWFPPKGANYVYIAADDEGIMYVADRYKSVGPYDDVYPEIHFDKAGKKMAFCARDGQQILWVVKELGDG